MADISMVATMEHQHVECKLRGERMYSVHHLTRERIVLCDLFLQM
jgi:hypothetical protein